MIKHGGNGYPYPFSACDFFGGWGNLGVMWCVRNASRTLSLIFRATLAVFAYICARLRAFSHITGSVAGEIHIYDIKRPQ